jgi:hypothetical protein
MELHWRREPTRRVGEILLKTRRSLCAAFLFLFADQLFFFAT